MRLASCSFPWQQPIDSRKRPRDQSRISGEDGYVGSSLPLQIRYTVDDMLAFAFVHAREWTDAQASIHTSIDVDRFKRERIHNRVWRRHIEAQHTAPALRLRRCEQAQAPIARSFNDPLRQNERPLAYRLNADLD